MSEFERVALGLQRLPEAGAIREARLAEHLDRAKDLKADASILTALLRTGECEALAQYLAHAPIASHIVSRVDRVQRSAEFDHAHREAFRAGRLDLLEVLLQAGISTHAIQAQLPALLRRPGAETSYQWLVCHDEIHVNFTSILEMVERCGDSVAPSYAPIIAQALEDRRILIGTEHLRRAFCDTSEKLFCVLLRAKPDQAAVMAVNDWDLRPDDPDRLAWLRLALSNHGRLELLRREPSLAEMIARRW